MTAASAASIYLSVMGSGASLSSFAHGMPLPPALSGGAASRSQRSGRGAGSGSLAPAASSRARKHRVESDFDAVESLARSRYYLTHPDDFREALRQAVRSSRVDIVEILLPVLNVMHDETIRPLHMAASHGSIDCVDLLLSAGFSATQTDSMGRTPLHCAAAATPASAGADDGVVLCAQALVAAEKKAVKMRDVSGATPLSVACSRQNIGIASVLVQAGASTSATDNRGRSPLDYAVEHKNLDLQGVLLGKDLRREAELSRELGRGGRSGTVDEKRIMEVWERFFENAFRSFADEADADAGLLVDEDALRSMEKRHKQGGGRTNVEQERRKGGKAIASTPAAHVETELEVDSVDLYLDELVSSWFEWILCFDESQQEYFVIHRYEYSTMWLPDFLEYYNDSSSPPIQESDLPHTCYLAFQDRWMQYYDDSINQCYWFQIYTGRCEHYLPLGHDYDAVVAGGMEVYEEEGGGGEEEDRGVWVRPGQYPCSSSWAAVSWYDDNTTADLSSDLCIAESKLTELSSAKYDDVSKIGKHSPPNDKESQSEKGAKANYSKDDSVVAIPEPKGSDAKSSFNATVVSYSWYFFNYFSGHSVWSEPAIWPELVATWWGGWWLCRDPDSGLDYW